MAFTSTSSSKTARTKACVDMISNLPEDVIHKIMQFLPLVDAARMSVLSKTWRNYWASIPQLVLDRDFIDLAKDNPKWDDDDDYGLDAYKWSLIISNILLLHKGSILEFSVTIPNFQSELCPDITPWISYVLENGVKNFALLNENLNYPIRLPSSLFSHGLLEHLALDECTISHSPCFTGLRNLSSLVFTYVEFEHGVATKFFACCPLLKKLKLTDCYFADGELIIINMPYLNKLSIKSEGTLPSINFKNASSLLSLSLNFSDDESDSIEGAIDMITYLANSCELQKLCLGRDTSELLASGGVLKILPTTLTQLKVLQLPWIKLYRKDVFSFVFGMIRSCLNMEEFNMSMRVPLSHNPEEVQLSENSETEEWALGHFDNDYTFNHLHTIYMWNIRGLSLELKLISYLLACSPSLKRLSFTCHRTLTDSTQQEVRRKLLEFRKASPKAKVAFVYPE